MFTRALGPAKLHSLLLRLSAMLQLCGRHMCKHDSLPSACMQGVNAHPRDYLNIFCLGNREPVEPNAPPPPKAAKPGSRQVSTCPLINARIISRTLLTPIY